MTALPNLTRKQPATWALGLGFVLIYLSWGTTYLAIQVGVRDEHLPPALFGGVRVCLAGVLLLAFLVLRRERLALSRQDGWRILSAGCLLFVAGNGLINIAERTVNSGVAAVLVATTPLWIGFFEMFWPGGERLTPRGWLGLFVGLGGVLLLLADKLRDTQDYWGETGLLLVLGSAAAWAVGSLVVRHKRLSCTHLAASAYQMIVGGGALALLGLACGEIGQLPDRVTAGAIGAFLYLLIVGSLVGFVSFNWLLGHVAAAKVGTYAYVNPVVAVFIGWLAGEEITVQLVGSITIILVGVGLVRGSEGKKAGVPALDPVTPGDVDDFAPVPSTAEAFGRQKC